MKLIRREYHHPIEVKYLVYDDMGQHCGIVQVWHWLSPTMFRAWIWAKDGVQLPYMAWPRSEGPSLAGVLLDIGLDGHISIATPPQDAR